MRCPFGYDHPATWRCFAAGFIDWLMLFEHWPGWVELKLMQMLVWLEDKDEWQ